MPHLIRKSLSESCPVCGVPAYTACNADISTQLNLDLDTDQGEVRFLEYQVISAIRRLREVSPDNLLVRTITLVLNYQSEDQGQP